jgi:polygalacturonase
MANVKDFGAAGDGQTDDTAAFQAAVATGLDVYVPAGVYVVRPLGVA